MKRTKEVDTLTLNAERTTLLADRTRREEQRAAIARELEDAEMQCATLTGKREALRLAALAEKDPAALEEFEEVTRQSAGAVLKRDDLAGVAKDLDGQLAKLNVKLRGFAFRIGRAELRAKQEEHRALARAFEEKADALVAVARTLMDHARAMSEQGARFGVPNAHRLTDPAGMMGTLLKRLAPAHPMTRRLDAFHEPLETQVATWDDLFPDCEPPPGWQPDASATDTAHTEEPATVAA